MSVVNDKGFSQRKSKKVLTNGQTSAIIIPVAGTAGVAQLVEQLICNQQVGGSNPSTSSTKVHMGEFQSGQMGQTVNLLSLTSVVRIHLPPPKPLSERIEVFCCIWGREWYNVLKPSPWGEGAQCAHWADEGASVGRPPYIAPSSVACGASFPPRGSL